MSLSHSEAIVTHSCGVSGYLRWLLAWLGRIIMVGLLVAILGCGSEPQQPEPPKPPPEVPASMTVGLDPLIDSLEVRVADSLVALRGGQVSHCVVWPALTSPQTLNFRVWYLGRYLGDVDVSWELRRAQHIRAWGQVAGNVWVGWTRVDGECSGTAG